MSPIPAGSLADRLLAPRPSGSTLIAMAFSICLCVTTSSGRPNTMYFAASMASASPTVRPKLTEARPAGSSTIVATGLLRMSRQRAASSTRVRNHSAWPCSMITRMAGPICSWPTIRSLTSCTETCAMAPSRMSRWRLASRSAPRERRAPGWASMRLILRTQAKRASPSPISTTK